MAVAIVEDLDYGAADSRKIHNYNLPITQVSEVLVDVGNERVRQDEKWGPQSHDAKTWLAILMEEVGEAAEEVSIPGRRDTRSPVDYIVDRMQNLGIAAKELVDDIFSVA